MSGTIQIKTHYNSTLLSKSAGCTVNDLVIRYDMPFDFYDLANKKKSNPSWRLMNADNAPLIISFFDKVFRQEGLRQIDEYEIVLKLEDYLYDLNDNASEPYLFSKSAISYLNDWSDPEKNWLRKFYPSGEDIPHYELTPGSEKVLQWMDSLSKRRFVGTESRLQTCFELLRQIVQGVETDSQIRIAELEQQKRSIELEIARIASGDIPMLDQRQIRERFMQFKQTAQELRSDFTAVDTNFRELDREIREEIATWDGKKGELLEQFFGDRDRINESDEGQSFRAFWDFIMAPDSQEELSKQLDRVFELEELEELKEDSTLRRIHFDWIDAGEKTQRTIARLSAQLRRFLDDRVYLENRRITEILDSIEKNAMMIKDRLPSGTWMDVENSKADIRFPMEQPLFTPPPVQQLVSMIQIEEEQDIDTSGLFNLVFINKEQLLRNISQSLRTKTQIRLGQLLEEHPLQQGLAELITYLQIAEENPFSTVSEEEIDHVTWISDNETTRKARIPRIIFTRRNSNGS